MDHVSRRKIVSRIENGLLLLGFLLLLLFSIIYYKERILYTDTAWYLTDMIKRNVPVMPTNRYIGLLAQLLPWTARQLHLPLAVIMMLYSVNMILFPLLTALTSVCWFRETKTAWSILLYYTIMNSILFYYPVSEYQMGLCLLLFYMGMYRAYTARRVSAPAFWVWSFLLIPTIIFSHPMAVLVWVAWWIWLLFAEKKDGLKTRLKMLGIMAPAWALKTFVFYASFDETRKTGLSNFNHFQLEYLAGPMGKSAIGMLLKDYFLVPVLLLLVLTALVRARKYLAALTLAGILVGFWVLITVSFKDEFYNCYYEHIYLALPFFMALAFGWYAFGVLNRPAVAGFLSILLVISFAKIDTGKRLTAARIKWYEACFALMEQKHVRKVMIKVSDIKTGASNDTYWAAPFESLLLSSLKGKNASCIIFPVMDMNTSVQQFTAADVIYGWGVCFPESELPAEYFNLEHQPYQVLDSLITRQQLDQMNGAQ